MQERTLFLGYIHYFRALAITFIVFGHVIDAFIWDEGSALERILRIFISNGSTLFVFIGGYLFQHLSPQYRSNKYFKSKVKHVIAPYLLISIPALLIFTTFLERETVWQGFYDNPVFVQIGLFYMTGKHLAPLWFIPMISIFYVVSPLLIKADKNNTIYYFLPLFIVISCFVGRGLPYQSFIHFFSVYLLGMACSKYKDTINPILSNCTFIVGSFLIVLFFATTEFFRVGGTMSWLNYLQKIFMSVFFLGLFFRINDKLNSKIIGYTAEVSFGVFFIHSYFISGNKLIYTSFLEKLPAGNMIFFILLSIATLTACVCLVFAFQKITGKYSRVLIGS
ncbi:hypothetical protein A9Q99_11160 [Gammaproteobacteria bacterium 45_16_T64]|nr:hypothetical protein A9Q99_11160 [Gammaproteobacteria bacterium 45_16_T64]